MALTIEKEICKVLEKDKNHVFLEVTWQEYESFLQEIGDSSWCKITYLDGLLQVMSPSKNHENIKENIGALILAYCDEKEIDYVLLGSTTYKSKVLKIGKEPDISYAIAEDKDIPDIAVEINFSSGSLNDLKIYQELGVKEVWMWNKDNQLSIYILEKRGYKQTDKSLFFDDIDSEIIEKYVLLMNQNKSKARGYKKQFIAEIKLNSRMC